MMNSKGTALVTGAARRIGRALALGLAETGYDLVIHYDSSKEDAETTAADCRALGVNAVTLQADLTDRDDIAGLVPAAATACQQPLNVLINNASIFEYDNIETGSFDNWDRHFRSNLEAPYFLTQAFAKQLPADASGVVINMIDQRVRKLTPEFSTYTLAKSALWTFTQTAAQGLAPRIRVNGIAPGPTIRGARQSQEHFDRQRAATILGEGSSPEGIVAAMHFILASKEFTGQLLCIDGGQHLAWKTPDILGEI